MARRPMAGLWRGAALRCCAGALLVGGLCAAADYPGLPQWWKVTQVVAKDIPLQTPPPLPKCPPPQLSDSPQVAFLWGLCLPVPKSAPQSEPMGGTDSDAPPIPVLVAPPGFRKTTVARMVAKVSEGAVYHLTRDELKGKAKDRGTINTPVFSVPTDLVYREIRKLLLTAQPHCIILDDVMGGTDPATPENLREFLKELQSLTPGQRVLILTSNEGFESCIEDSKTARELIEIVKFPPPSIPELTSALQDALKHCSVSPTNEAFADVPPEVTPKLLTEALVGKVAGQLPVRHGRSMRVWGLVLRHLSAKPHAGSPEAFRAALMEALRSPEFLVSVSEKVDLTVAKYSRVHGLLKSSPMPLEDLQKLRKLLGMPALAQPKDKDPLQIPGRLALLALLRAQNAAGSEVLYHSLEKEIVQPEVRRLMEMLHPKPWRVLLEEVRSFVRGLSSLAEQP